MSQTSNNMGRYSFAAQNVHKRATQLLHAYRIPAPPPWYHPITITPPATRLTRPPLQRPNTPSRASKKSSRLFQPLSLKYAEDQLRWEYYNDHPWELARPRVVLENDGRDRERYDWSVPLDYSLRRPKTDTRDEFGRDHVEWEEVMEVQGNRPINGEACVFYLPFPFFGLFSSFFLSGRPLQQSVRDGADAWIA